MFIKIILLVWFILRLCRPPASHSGTDGRPRSSALAGPRTCLLNAEQFFLGVVSTSTFLVMHTMSMDEEQVILDCGCKGIRSCLKCEHLKEKPELNENGQTVRASFE